MSVQGQKINGFSRYALDKTLRHSPMTSRISIGIFLFALAIRGALLAINETFIGLDPYWSYQARAGLFLVLSDFGTIPLDEAFETLRHMTVDAAVQAWPVMDRGIVYLHLLLKSVFGTTSYMSLQGLSLVVDALLVFPVMSIAYALSQNKKIAYSAGFLYGIFLPQVWIAIQPDYNAWLTTGYILTTWLYLNIITLTQGGHRWRSLLVYSAALFVVMLIVNQIRSTIIFLPIGMAAWWWATTLLTTRSLAFPRRNWPPALALLGVGILVIGVSGALNKSARDDASPVRSTLGHAFWTGVGQFDNPYGLRDADGSPMVFYQRETGITETDTTTGGVAYNAWLTQRAGKFIKEHPVLYASMVARRALWILFPNMPFTAVADKAAYDRSPIELTRIKNRIELQKKHGRLSPTTIRNLIPEDPTYVIGLFFRLALIMLLPLGCVSFFIFSTSRALGLAAIIPLAYHVITLSPIYVTPIILIPAYAAIIPIIVIGWWLAIQKLSNALRPAHD